MKNLARCRPTMAGSRTGAVAVIATAAAVVTATQFASSYHNLLDWALRHEIGEPWAWLWPLGVDSFVVIGEARLFVSAIDRDGWKDGWRPLAWAWACTIGGLAASTAANVGHAGWHVPAAVMVSYSIPPLAAAAGLGTLLGLVKAGAGKTAGKTAAGQNGKPVRVVREPAPSGRAEHLRIVRTMEQNRPGQVSIEDVRRKIRKGWRYSRDLLAEVRSELVS